MDWTALLGGERPPASIVRANSSAGATPISLVAGYGGEKVTLSGALTANTLKTLLSISGPGVLKFCAVSTIDTATRTLRLKITLDGVVVYDPGMSASVSAIYATIIGVGGVAPFNYTTPNFTAAFERVPFNSSCLVEVASSLSETDKLMLLHAYETR